MKLVIVVDSIRFQLPITQLSVSGAERKVDRWFAIAEYWGSEGKVGIMFVIARG